MGMTISIPDIFVYEMEDGRAEVVLGSSQEIARTRLRTKYEKLPARGHWRRLVNEEYVRAYARDRMQWKGVVSVSYRVTLYLARDSFIDAFEDWDIAYLHWWINTMQSRRSNVSFTSEIVADITHYNDCLILPLGSITETKRKK